MKNIWNKAACLLLASPLLFTACEKNDSGTLEGAVPQTDFTTTIKPVGLTTEVTFTSTNADAFLYQWSFGDGSVGTGKTVTHIYKKSGTVKAQLITAYRGGTSLSAVKDVVLPQNIDFVKQLLTGSGSKTWMLNNAVDAPIVVGTEGNPSEYFNGVKAGGLPPCQADDEYTFTSAGVFTYNAKAETFVAGGVGCSTQRSGTSEFTFGPATGEGFAMFEFKKAGTFIGVTDAPDLTYRIIDISDKSMLLRAGKPGGTVFQMKLVPKP
ncbi:PKD domain-containing protein [Hymenobacter sp. BT491]|uniref:PKD domain-containing protein n=1 Tax=Hymenobacter sp. BT491 TaxID=2766779 RepID=UPI001653C60D|nr:PKD domain-containing protein [Hymenobacter sp. BT491]MBC6989228.1 PKD domain-containing protein [Hymenobacter sp. BT491]